MVVRQDYRESAKKGSPRGGWAAGVRRTLLLVSLLVLCVSSVAYAKEPETMAFGATAQGQFTATESTVWYQLTLPSAGRVRLSLKAQLSWLTCALYDADMQRVWSSNPRWDSAAGEIACTQSVDLTAGTYTLVLTAEQENTGAYSVSATFAAA